MVADFQSAKSKSGHSCVEVATALLVCSTAAFGAEVFASTFLTRALLVVVFLLDTFFATAFLETTFFAVDFVEAASARAAFFTAVAVFVVDAFVVAFLAAAFFVVGFPDEIDESVESPASAINNLVRSFEFAIHAGARPRPLHVAPLFGSRYRAGCGPRT